MLARIYRIRIFMPCIVLISKKIATCIISNHSCSKMYGQKLLEFVQGPGEVLFLPQGLTHSILNLHDNVAYTENYLYIGALPGRLSKYSA